jgi:hypothetical protein
MMDYWQFILQTQSLGCGLAGDVVIWPFVVLETVWLYVYDDLYIHLINA